MTSTQKATPAIHTTPYDSEEISRPNIKHTVMKISLDDPDNNQSGTSLPIKRAQEQLSNDLGPSRVVSDNSQDDDGGPPSKKKRPSQTAIVRLSRKRQQDLQDKHPMSKKFLKMAIRSTQHE